MYTDLILGILSKTYSKNNGLEDDGTGSADWFWVLVYKNTSSLQHIIPTLICIDLFPIWKTNIWKQKLLS